MAARNVARAIIGWSHTRARTRRLAIAPSDRAPPS